LEDDDDLNQSEVNDNDDFNLAIKSVERLQKRIRLNTLSKYRCVDHVSKDSNVVERLFSRAKLVMRDHRKHII
jgi:hypothetical protein